MEPLEMQNAYYAFIKEHRAPITELLRKEYASFRDHPADTVLRTIDFGGCVGVPLFFIGVLWVVSTKAFNHWMIAAILIGFGFWLRYYQKHTVEITCRHFFNRGEGKEVLDAYISQCKVAAVCKEAESVHDNIAQLYDYCHKHLWPDEFRYYK